MKYTPVSKYIETYTVNSRIENIMSVYPNPQDEYESIPIDQPYQKCLLELKDLLRSRYSLIFLRSPEENRAVRCAIRAHDECIDEVIL